MVHRNAAAGRSEIEEWLAHQSVETYDDAVVRRFALMTVVWGVLGTTLGALLVLQRCWPALSSGIAWLTYNRLRPLHVNVMIYAFAGCALLASAYYGVQRTCHVRLLSERTAAFTFWGWQVAIVAAATAQLLGIIQGGTPAYLEWLAGLLISGVWVACAIVFLGTIARRRVPQVPLADWFFAACIVALAVLYVLDSLAGSLRLAKSHSAYAGSLGPVLQGWSGHNTEGLFLTAGFFGMVYLFVPRQAQRPVYSRRLGLLQLWALIAVYVWAGPYELHYDSLPAWVQLIGMVFSLLLLAAAWTGMLNGFLTLSGAWERLREDWILRFMIVSLCFYGFSSFEGPMMAIHPPDGLPQYAGWLLGHVQSGMLGWVALMVIGALYQLIPQLFDRERMHSTKLIDAHFWLATSGMLLYMASLWIAGLVQRALIEDGASSLELVDSITPLPFRLARFLGGVLFCTGVWIMAYNVWMTARGAQPVTVPVTAPEPELTPEPQVTAAVRAR